MARKEKDINKLLEQFNKLDTSPMTTRDYVLGLEQAKSGVKNLTQKEADKLFPEKLTDEDIDNLRAAREQEVALKRGLIAANEAKTVTKRTKTIAKAGKLNSGLQGLNFFNKEAEKQVEQQAEIEKLKQEFQPSAQVVKKGVKENIEPSTIPEFNSGLKNLPMIKQIQEEFSGRKKDSKDTANFDYDFLINTQGKLQKDPLLEILISTWNEGYNLDDEIKKQRKREKQIKGEQGDDGIDLLDILLGWGLFKFLKAPLRLASKALKKLLKTKIGRIVKIKLKKFMRKLFKYIKAPFKYIFGKLKDGLKYIYDKVAKWVRGAIKYASDLIKSTLSKISAWWNRMVSSAENLWNMAKAKGKEIINAAKRKAAQLIQEAKSSLEKGKQFLEKAKRKAGQLWDKTKGKLSITEYRVLKEKNNISLLDINLKTGRKNQIRVHMRDNNTPILGDVKYSNAKNEKRMYLHAYRLKLINPKTKKEIIFETNIPKEFNKKI